VECRSGARLQGVAPSEGWQERLGDRAPSEVRQVLWLEWVRWMEWLPEGVGVGQKGDLEGG
jgi:hypothetical protein